jgi:3'-phosphoadenosine 5'-phosphosulfate sulfotransferase (PAPS reductase)/FAD synthetase
MKIAVWFSCGAASAAALKLTVEKYGLESVYAVNNPVVEEDEDNVRFARDVANWVGIDIQFAVNSKYPNASAVEVFEHRKGMSFPHGAPCTVELKKRARQEWEKDNYVDWHVLGFTVEERSRHDRFVLTERENVLPILIDARMTKNDCADMIRAAGIKLPEIYSKGFPNANCVGCVKASSPTYWNLVRREYPNVFKERAEQSKRLGARLVRVAGKRIFLDDLDPSAKGRPLKVLPDCGLFCEEK